MTPRNKKLDLNELAARIVGEATGEPKCDIDILNADETAPRGQKGGLARSKNKSKEELIDQARLAAMARWKKSN